MSTLRAIIRTRERARWPYADLKSRGEMVIREYRDRYRTAGRLANALGISIWTINGWLKGYRVPNHRLFEVWVSGPPSCAIIAGEIIQRIYP
jgi:hypothetical protein